MSGEPRYDIKMSGGAVPQASVVCLDCGVVVADQQAHTRFHSILSGHAWSLAVLKTAHLGDSVHSRFDVVERIDRRKFDSWSADALAEVVNQLEGDEMGTRKPQMTVSIDIETDGPVPGLNSMLSLGAVAIDEHDAEISTWYETMLPLEKATQNIETMKWWDTQPEAWAIVCRDPQRPEYSIARFIDWLESLPGNLVAVAWPAAFDFSFVNYYCWKFHGRNPLGFACLDIRSYADGLANRADYYGISEEEIRKLAGEVNKTGLRAHVSLDDAIEQGRLYVLLRQYAKWLSV